MKSYGQYCGLARALDVVGERWTLLIVRELLTGPRRYTELLEDLPGIATNLLADRLRNLEAGEVVLRDHEGRYALTEWGQALHEAVYALGRWAGPLMARPRGDDHFRPSWLAHMIVARFDGLDPDRDDLVVEITCEGETFTLVSEEGVVRLTPGEAVAPDVRLAGPAELAVGVLLGRISPTIGAKRGVTIEGATDRLAGLRPRGGRALAATFGSSSPADSRDA